MSTTPEPNDGTIAFGELEIGDYFVVRDHLWEKVGDEAAIADGYEASNYFGELARVRRPKNATSAGEAH